MVSRGKTHIPSQSTDSMIFCLLGVVIMAVSVLNSTEYQLLMRLQSEIRFAETAVVMRTFDTWIFTLWLRVPQATRSKTPGTQGDSFSSGQAV